MELGGEWDWLGDPEEWSAPDDLRHPTRIPRINLVIQILTSEMVGNDVIKLLGELLAAHAEFNLWFGSVGKLSVAPEELVERSARSTEVLRQIYECWSGFSITFEASGRRAGSADVERRALVHALQEGVTELRSLLG